MNNQKFILFSTILAILVTLSPVTATDLTNSSWPKYQHDLNNTGQSQYLGPQTNQTKWNFTTSISSSGISIGNDGTIYVGGRNQTYDCNLFAINPNGTLKWNFGTPVDVTSTPAIDSDGNIYFSAMELSSDYFYALYPNGTQKWNYTMSDMIWPSPVVGSDGTIYMGCSDGYLYAFNQNGTIKWKAGQYDSIVTTPAISLDGTIYFGTASDTNQGFLFAINPDGTEKWNFEALKIWSSPSISSDGTIYFGSNDGNLYALYPNGTQKWSFAMSSTGGDVSSTPAIASDGTIYMGSNNGILYVLKDAVDHAVQKWIFDTGVFNSVFTPAIGSDGTIYFRPGNNILYALNPDGSSKWNFTTSGSASSSIAINNDGTLYFIDSDCSYGGKLYAIKGQQSSLYVKTSVNNANPKVGDIITLTFKVGNNGPDTAYNTIMKFVIPAGMKFLSANADMGTWNFDTATNTITWDLGNVPVGDPTLNVLTEILRAGTYTIQPILSTLTYDPNLVNSVQTIVVSGQANLVKANTVGMQETGVPINYMIMAILLVISGLIVPKRK